MKNVSTKLVEEIKEYILFSITFLKKIRTVWEIMWKYTIQPDRPHLTVWLMRIAFWITKATHTHTNHIVARTRLNITLCVHCLSCLKWTSAINLPYLPGYFLISVNKLTCKHELFMYMYIYMYVYWYINWQNTGCEDLEWIHVAENGVQWKADTITEWTSRLPEWLRAYTNLVMLQYVESDVQQVPLLQLTAVRWLIPNTLLSVVK